MKKFLISLANLGFRGFSLGAKFLLIFYIGKYFAYETLGLYGIFTTTVTLSVFLLGFDFYRYSAREILALPFAEQASVIKDQFLYYLATYVLFLPLLGFIFFFKVIPIHYFYYFYLILIFEHLSQELFRLFTILSRPLYANFLMFIRSGLWVMVLLSVWFYSDNQALSLKTVWVFWISGAGISIILGFYSLMRIYKGVELKPIDPKWFIKGTKISIFYLGSTIAYKVIEFSDRYMIDYLLGKKEVGIYTFFSQISNLINVVIFTTILMVLYPLLVKAYNEQNWIDFDKIKVKISKQVIYLTCFVALGLLISINPILNFMGKPEFSSHIYTVYMLIVANIILNVSYIPHFLLYAYKKDSYILYTTVAGAFVNLIGNLILINFYGILGAAIATCASFAAIWLMKLFYQKKTEAFNFRRLNND